MRKLEYRLISRVVLALLAAICLGAWCCSSPAFAADEKHPAAEKASAAESHEKGGGHGQQGPITWDTDLALWSLITFLLFVVVLKKFAWGPLSAGLDKREEGIRKNIADAEQARLKAEKMLAEHAEKLNKVQDEVREILAEARRDADHAKQEIMSEAQREADATKSRAINEINRARDAALKDLFDAMGAQVANATEHVLGRSLTGADQDRLIEEALAQVSSK